MTSWADTKHQAIAGFNGELPTNLTEQEIVEAFTLEPVAVLQTLAAVIEDVKAGKARSGWAIWRTRIATAITRADVHIEATNRPRQIQLTEWWLRNSGGYLDRAEELVDAVFGPNGRLYLWDEDKPLVDRIVCLWEAQRPRFAKAEQEAEARQARQAETLKRLRKASRSSLIPEHADLVASEVERALAPPIDDDFDEQVAATLDLDRPADPPESETT